MSLDYSAVPRMPDGRTALETIESVAATSEAIRVPMGPRSAGGNGKMMWHVWGRGSGKPALLRLRFDGASTPVAATRGSVVQAAKPRISIIEPQHNAPPVTGST